MSYASDLQDVAVTLKVETPKAWGFIRKKGPGVVWIPKSAARFTGGDPPSNAGVLSAPSWLLIEKGLV
jgi:hypothetical protein